MNEVRPQIAGQYADILAKMILLLLDGRELGPSETLFMASGYDRAAVVDEHKPGPREKGSRSQDAFHAIHSSTTGIRCTLTASSI